MEIIIQPDPETASRLAARVIVRLLRAKPDAVLGLATGSTPLLLYRELVRLHAAGEADFRRVRTFNLDEYIGLPPEHPQSYHSFMWQNLFQHINIDPQNVRIPDGLAADVPAFCASSAAEISSFSCRPSSTTSSPAATAGTPVTSTTIWSMVIRPRTGQR